MISRPLRDLPERIAFVGQSPCVLIFLRNGDEAFCWHQASLDALFLHEHEQKVLMKVIDSISIGIKTQDVFIFAEV